MWFVWFLIGFTFFFFFSDLFRLRLFRLLPFVSNCLVVVFWFVFVMFFCCWFVVCLSLFHGKQETTSAAWILSFRSILLVKPKTKKTQKQCKRGGRFLVMSLMSASFYTYLFEIPDFLSKSVATRPGLLPFSLWSKEKRPKLQTRPRLGWSYPSRWLGSS